MSLQSEESSLVRINSAPHPFLTSQTTKHVPAGLNVEEMLEAVQADPILRRHAHVFVDEMLVPREKWGTVKPGVGSMVSIRIVPSGGGGGGKNPLRTVLSLAVIAASFGFGGALGGAIFGSSIAAGTSAAIGSAIILTAGTLLVNAIAPIRPPEGASRQSARESPTYFLDAARNTARPYQPIPVVLGTHKQVPPLAAVTYTEVVGDTNHLRMLLVWGYGPLEIEDIQIGETPLTDFADFRIENREGRAGDTPITIYPDEVNEEQLAVTLTESLGWVERTTAADEADELSVDVTLPRGLVQYNNRGEKESHTVTIQIQYRQVGIGPWLTPDFRATESASTIDSGWIGTDGMVSLMGSVNQPIRHGFRWSVPNRAQYEIRMRRVSEEPTEDRIFDEVIWSVIRTFKDEDPIRFEKPLAVTAIDIRASDQFNRVVDQVNATIHAEILDWTGVGWVAGRSSNPASIFRAVLQHSGRARPASDEQINLKALEEWHTFCVMNGYEFDAVIDYQKSIWNILADIAAAGRASPQWADGQWTVVVDTGEQMPVQHFTPRNSSNFRLERVFEPPPDAFRCRFKNRDQGYRTDERTVYNDGFDETNAQEFVSIEPWESRNPIISTSLRVSSWRRFCSGARGGAWMRIMNIS